MQLVPSDPFRSPTELMESEASLRRLFLVKFSCPLCGQDHSCEIYLTLIAPDEDKMMEKAVEILNRDDVMVRSLAPFARNTINGKETTWNEPWRTPGTE